MNEKFVCVYLLHTFAVVLYNYSSMYTKKDRLSAIREIISSQVIGNQEELLKILKTKGFNITQATLSRDIKALKMIKSQDIDGNYIYTLPFDNRLPGISISEKKDNAITSGFISIEFSGNLAVVKTRPGYAMGIASDIDNLAGQVILGTIAGDDTILLIPRENISRKNITDVLSSFIPNIKS